jgi:hypothetical protein
MIIIMIIIIINKKKRREGDLLACGPAKTYLDKECLLVRYLTTPPEEVKYIFGFRPT